MIRMAIPIVLLQCAVLMPFLLVSWPLPLSVCRPLFDLHQATYDAGWDSAARQLWNAVSFICGDF